MEEKDKKEVALKTPEKILDLQLPTAEEVKKYLCPGATDAEIFLFLQTARMFGLNPFKRELYLIKYSSSDRAAIVTSYEVYLKRAESNPNWSGISAYVKMNDKNEVEKGICEVYRKDWDKPLIWEVDFKEYAQKKADGSLTRFWKDRPVTMIKKVAISQALRIAFPEEVGGLPSIHISEGDIIDAPIPAEVTEITDRKPEQNGNGAEQKLNGKKNWGLFWMTATNKRWSRTEVQKKAMADYGMKESMNELSQEQYEELLEFIRQNPKEKSK